MCSCGSSRCHPANAFAELFDVFYNAVVVTWCCDFMSLLSPYRSNLKGRRAQNAIANL